MSHGDHGGHTMPMPEGPRCEMNMLWNYKIENTCIVFRSWHISSTTAFVFSCLAVAALGVLYEYLRVVQARVDRGVAAALVAQGKGKARGASGRSSPVGDSEEAGLLTGLRAARARGGTPVPLPSRLLRAAMYATTVFLSFFLMLVFMTYNAYLIAAVVVGAGVGHYIFNAEIDVESVLYGTASGKGIACH